MKIDFETTHRHKFNITLKFPAWFSDFLMSGSSDMFEEGLCTALVFAPYVEEVDHYDLCHPSVSIEIPDKDLQRITLQGLYDGLQNAVNMLIESSFTTGRIAISQWRENKWAVQELIENAPERCLIKDIDWNEGIMEYLVMKEGSIRTMDYFSQAIPILDKWIESPEKKKFPYREALFKIQDDPPTPSR